MPEEALRFFRFEVEDGDGRKRDIDVQARNLEEAERILATRKNEITPKGIIKYKKSFTIDEDRKRLDKLAPFSSP